MMHFIGCSEWARAWIRKYKWRNLDATTRANLRDSIKAGRGSCCK